MGALQEDGVSRHSKCSRYAVDWQQLLNASDIDLSDVQPNSSWPTEYCFDGWNYNRTLVTSSIVIDVNSVLILALLLVVSNRSSVFVETVWFGVRSRHLSNYWTIRTEHRWPNRGVLVRHVERSSWSTHRLLRMLGHTSGGQLSHGGQCQFLDVDIQSSYRRPNHSCLLSNTVHHW